MKRHTRNGVDVTTNNVYEYILSELDNSSPVATSHAATYIAHFASSASFTSDKILWAMRLSPFYSLLSLAHYIISLSTLAISFYFILFIFCLSRCCWFGCRIIWGYIHNNTQYIFGIGNEQFYSLLEHISTSFIKWMCVHSDSKRQTKSCIFLIKLRGWIDTEKNYV